MWVLHTSICFCTGDYKIYVGFIGYIPMKQLRTKLMENSFLKLNWIKDSRPGDLTIGVNFCTESDVHVEKTQVLQLNHRKVQKK